MTFDTMQYKFQYQYLVEQEKKKQDNYAEFKERISAFKNVKTLAEAKELAIKILPTANEVNHFDIGDAKCIIINKKDRYRICLDSPKEFICYDFI